MTAPAMTVVKLATLAALVVLALGSWSSPARGDPLFGWGENTLEDRFVDGDVDEDDVDAMGLLGRRHTTRERQVGSSDVHGESWVSLVGFARELRSGRSDVGGFLVVGLALDRIGAGSTHRLSDPPHIPPAPSSPGAPSVGVASVGYGTAGHRRSRRTGDAPPGSRLRRGILARRGSGYRRRTNRRARRTRASERLAPRSENARNALVERRSPHDHGRFD
jgi:hypothetical protein